MEEIKKKKLGRPKKEIDYNQVKKLAGIFCTIEEIAGIIGVSKSSLDHNETFLQVYKNGLENAKMSLRRNQYRLSKTNPAVAIWLGKQYLGQREPSVQHEVNMNGFSTFVKKLIDDVLEPETNTEGLQRVSKGKKDMELSENQE